MEGFVDSYSVSPLYQRTPDSHRHLSDQDWEDHRTTISQLYTTKGNSLHHVIRIMKEQYEFFATDNQYKKRLRRWNIYKNIKSREMKFIVRKQAERTAEGKCCGFRVRGQLVEDERIRRSMKRESVRESQVDLQSSSAGGTPSDISCYTPPTGRPPPSDSMLMDQYAVRSPLFLPATSLHHDSFGSPEVSLPHASTPAFQVNPAGFGNCSSSQTIVGVQNLLSVGPSGTHSEPTGNIYASSTPLLFPPSPGFGSLFLDQSSIIHSPISFIDRDPRSPIGFPDTVFPDLHNLDALDNMSNLRDIYGGSKLHVTCESQPTEIVSKLRSTLHGGIDTHRSPGETQQYFGVSEYQGDTSESVSEIFYNYRLGVSEEPEGTQNRSTLGLDANCLELGRHGMLVSTPNLASACLNQGQEQWQDAEALQVQVMETSPRVLGQEQSDARTGAGNLASSRRGQGLLREAEEAQIRGMEINTPSPVRSEYSHHHHIHQLSPTAFLPRAADNQPHAIAIQHVTANSQPIRLTYRDFADCSRGLAYYLRKHGHKRVGILCPNTPAFLISIFGIPAAGAINTAVNHRLNTDDIAFIFDHSEVDAIVVDREFVGLLDGYRKNHPKVKLIIDEDRDKDGEFYDAVEEGWRRDEETGGKGWAQLNAETANEDSVIALAYTSGTTAKPKGAEYTHRGVYLAAMGNVIESGLNYYRGRAGYLWTLHMFHAMGWTFPWAVTFVCGTHYCLRKINYTEIWSLLKGGNITHFSASPTVSKRLCADPSAEALLKPVRVTVAASQPTPHLFENMVKLNLLPMHVYGLTETYGPIAKAYYMPEWDEIPVEEMFQRLVRQGHGFITSLPIRVIKEGLPKEEIVDVKKDGKEIGEIVFVGNLCTKGYYKNPEATRELFAGGVLHSGDLAVWHEDGSVQIQDRQNDIIISGGQKFSSVAVELVLETHPDILDAGVIAVADKVLGERPKAYVTGRPGTHLKGRDVIEWAKHKNWISKFMVPKDVEVVDNLPDTGTGKVKKYVLRMWAEGRRENIRCG